MKYLVFTLSLLLTACSSTPPEAPIKKVQLTHIINHSLFEQVKTPSEHSIFELSEPVKKRVFNLRTLAFKQCTR